MHRRQEEIFPKGLTMYTTLSLTRTADLNIALARSSEQISHPPSVRSLGWTVGRRLRRGTCTALPLGSLPRRAVDAMQIEPQ